LWRNIILRILGFIGSSYSLLSDARKEAGTGRDVGTSLQGVFLRREQGRSDAGLSRLNMTENCVKKSYLLARN